MGDYVLDGLLPRGSLSVSLFSGPEYDEIWARAESRTAELLQCIQPSNPSEERRKAVIDYVERLIERNFNCKVFAFGSVPLKTYLPNGDIDLTAISELPLDDIWANDLCSILEDEERSHIAKFQVKEVKCIRAEVPVVKCLVENIIVDITFNQIGGLSTLCFLEEVDRLIGQDHLFKRSLILVKAWCFYESRILGAYHGLLSTYALETLVLYVFHVFHWSLRGPLEVLFRFLQFFSNFDWNQYCLSLLGPIRLVSLHNMAVESHQKHRGRSLLSEAFLNACREAYYVYPGNQGSQGKTFSQKFMNVLDPLRSDNNLGRSVNKGNFVRIHSAFAYGAGQLEKLFKSPVECLDENLVAFFRNTESHCRGNRPDAPDPHFRQVQVHVDVSSCGDKVGSKHATISEGNIEPKVALGVQEPQRECSGSLMQTRTYKQMLLGNAFGEEPVQADKDTKSSSAMVSDTNIVDMTTSISNTHRVQVSGQTAGKRKKKGKFSSNLFKERFQNVDVGTGSLKNCSISNSRNCINVEDSVSCQSTSCDCDSCNNLKNNTPFKDPRSNITNSRTISSLGPLVSFETQAQISQAGMLQELHDAPEYIGGKTTHCMVNTRCVVGREIFGKSKKNLVSMGAVLPRQQKPIDGNMKHHHTPIIPRISHASPQDSPILNQSTRDPTPLSVTSGGHAIPCHPGLEKEICMIPAFSDALRSGNHQQDLSNHQGDSTDAFQSLSDSNMARETDFGLTCTEALISPHGSADFSESTGNESVWFTAEDDTGGSETSLKALEQEVRSSALETESKSQRVGIGNRACQQGIPSRSRVLHHEKNFGANDSPNGDTDRTQAKLSGLNAASTSEVMETRSRGQQPGGRKQKPKFIAKVTKHKHPVSDFNNRSFDSEEGKKMNMEGRGMTPSLLSLNRLIEEQQLIEPSVMQYNASHRPSSLLQTKDNRCNDLDRLRQRSQSMNAVLHEKVRLRLGGSEAVISGPDSDRWHLKGTSSFSETVMCSDVLIHRRSNIKSQEDIQSEEREPDILRGDFANHLQISEGGHDEFPEIKDTEADILKGDFAAHLQNLAAGRCFQNSRLYGSIPSASSTLFRQGYTEEGSSWEGTGRTGNANVFAQISSSRNGVVPVLTLNRANLQTRGAMPGNFLTEGFSKFQKGTGTFFPTVRRGFDREKRLTSVKGPCGVTRIDLPDPVNQNGTSACRSKYHGQKKRDVQNKSKTRFDRKSLEIKTKERDSDISWEDSVHTSTLCSPSDHLEQVVCPFTGDRDPGFFGDTFVNGTDYSSKPPAVMALPSGPSKDLPIEKLEFGSFGPFGLKGSLSGSFQQVLFSQENGGSMQDQQNSQHREPSESCEAHAKSGNYVELHPSSPQSSYHLKDEDFPPLTFFSQRERSTGFAAQKS